ncbi:MAG: ABC transporter permease [Bryobacteraceae bacterium]
MDTLRELLARLRSFFRKQARDEDLDQELSAHLDFAIEDNIRRGMAPEEARRRALVSIGGIERAKEEHRDSRGLPALDTIVRDLRYAVRTLRRDAGLATFAVLIVGLGVGASSTVFSVVDALLLRPLPFDDPGRLVWIANGQSENLSAQTVQVANLLELREHSQSFSVVAGYSPFYGAGDIRLTGTGEPERLTGVPVTEDFFRLVGIQPQLGRFFTAEECRWNAPKAVVLSHGFWQRRFAADRGIVGRSIILDGAPATLVGVLPASFDFASTFTPGSRADLFYPFPLSPETNRSGNMLALIGRLKPGVDLRTAQTEATVIGARIQTGRREGQWRNAFHPNLSTLRDRISGRFRYALLVLAGAVGFLMLLVCANISNLLLARASARQKEMAIRTALGAGRWRLIRQMLIESVLLSCCGAAVGLALAFGGTSLLARLDGTNIPLLQGVQVDAAALAFTLAIAVLTGIVFGLVPALQASASSPHSALKESSRGSIGSRDRAWTRGSLVVCEIALACVLLTSAGLLMRSLVSILDVELGFDTDSVLTLRIDPGRAHSTHVQQLSYFDRVLHNVRSVPGVQAAGLTDALPLGENFGWRTWTLSAKGQVYERDRRPHALVRIVDESYLETMRISLRAGRSFTHADNASAEPVIMVNETLARTLWPGENPLGRLIRTSGDRDWRVIGVTGGVRYFGFESDSGAEMYLPIRQSGDFNTVDLVVRASRTPSELAPRIRAALKTVDPNMPATRFRTMRELVDHSVFPRRFVVLLLTGFAGFGLILASLGIYGVISYSVTRRKQEIGIRMALGASAGNLQRGIVAQTLVLALVGLMIGVPAAWMAARAIQGLLFGVTSSDPVTFAAVLALLVAVAALAGYLPARRASRLNPLDALRCE